MTTHESAQYATVEQLREYLPLEDTTGAAVLGAAISRATALIIRETGGIVFGGPAVSVILDGKGRERLYLPPPGAAGIAQITEDGVTLDTTQYMLDPAFGLYLTRLDDDDQPTTWSNGRRNITVQYTPTPIPVDVEEATLEEAVRI